uniref:Uncharacterized protein n=1 Tax=Kalanchoe fedtschenkoi TaxID=63787 RepID=A0A7N0T2F3_KALFE
MAVRLGLVLLGLLALATALVQSSPAFSLDQYGVARLATADGGIKVGDLISYDEETMLTTESERRILAQAKKYISYGALKKNSVPCKKKGQSYYNCNSRQKANPYKRGCSKVTNCYRYTDL